MNVLNDYNLDPKQFRVVVFGSSRIKEGSPEYECAYEIGKAVGKLGADIVTGGGPGAMDAANRGHIDATMDPEDTSQSIGIRIQLPFEEDDSESLDMKMDFKKFSKRLDAFMQVSDMVIITPGGVGTLLELAFTWQLVQVKHIKNIPIVLVGEQWNSFYDWSAKHIIDLHFANKEDLDHLIPVPDYRSAITLVHSYHDKYLQEL